MRWAKRLDLEALASASQRPSRFTLWQPTQILLVEDSQFGEGAAGILGYYVLKMISWWLFREVVGKDDGLVSTSVSFISKIAWEWHFGFLSPLGFWPS